LTLAPLVAETHPPIQMSSSETNAVYLMETPKTKPNEAIFAVSFGFMLELIAQYFSPDGVSVK
jgi:hypothetical protein